MKVGELRKLIDKLPDQVEVLVDLPEAGLLAAAVAQVRRVRRMGQDPATRLALYGASPPWHIATRPEDGEALVIGR